MSALTLQNTHKRKLAMQSHSIRCCPPVGLNSPLPSPTLLFWKFFMVFNQPQDLQGCIAGCIYTAVSSLSIHMLSSRAQRSSSTSWENKRKTRSLTEFFNMGLMLGPESTTLPEKLHVLWSFSGWGLSEVKTRKISLEVEIRQWGYEHSEQA